SNKSSRRVKARLFFPTRNITVIPVAARSSVGAVGENIEGTMVTWTLVHVGLAPGIGGHVLFLIKSVPALHPPPLGPLRLPTPLCCRITSDIQTKRVQSGAQELDLGLGCLNLCLFLLANESRPYQCREQTDDNHDHKQLNQRESAIVSHLLRRVSHSC